VGHICNGNTLPRSLNEPCSSATSCIVFRSLVRYGKKLVVVAAELDTGKEVQFSYETHPNLMVCCSSWVRYYGHFVLFRVFQNSFTR
jgi:hypothetical protein